MTDTARTRRESIRWRMLNVLNLMRPHTLHETALHDHLRAIYPEITQIELRREADYLEGRKLVEIVREPFGAWFLDLTRCGVDIVEYTIDCSPGIARPPKYWED